MLSSEVSSGEDFLPVVYQFVITLATYYAFVAEDGAYNFNSSDLLDDDFKDSEFPVTLDWTIGYITCSEARKDAKNFACKENSTCVDSENGGYLCQCDVGFEGNPYVSNGCEDIDECETLKPCRYSEFVTNVTLFDHIHNVAAASILRWETRLRIATETAEALSYLHSAASVLIIHRDIKLANILLDDRYTAKVSDFGASRLIPSDEAEIATVVQGTFGYLDPEYIRTSLLTEKSDVYSFGVLLVELLTGQRVVSFERSEKKRVLAMYFLTLMKEDRLLEILDSRLLKNGNAHQQLKEVAALASRCVKLKGDERPTMKEVAHELAGLQAMATHAWSKSN
ncbi:hypothetical protein PTKIN_Ptkin01aG0017600 [Pterospermum kingtungense]